MQLQRINFSVRLSQKCMALLIRSCYSKCIYLVKLRANKFYLSVRIIAHELVNYVQINRLLCLSMLQLVNSYVSSEEKYKPKVTASQSN